MVGEGYMFLSYSWSQMLHFQKFTTRQELIFKKNSLILLPSRACVGFILIEINAFAYTVFSDYRLPYTTMLAVHVYIRTCGHW